MKRSQILDWAVSYLLSGYSLKATVACCCLAVLLYASIGPRSADLQQPWKVDEGERIGEGYFWRLIAAGDVSNPDWFRDISMTSHPPFSKYFFGAAVRLGGVEPPRNLDLVHAYDAGAPANTLPAQFAAEYQPMLRPARLASFACNVVAAVTIFGIALRVEGLMTALLTQILLFRHYLFHEALFYARSDTVQTAAVTITIAALLYSVGARRNWSGCIAAGLAGVFAGLAFQTRLNGGVALLMTAAFLIASRLPARQIIARVLMLGVAFGAVSVIISPYYWAQPRTTTGLRSDYVAHEPLLLRIPHRYEIEVRELNLLLKGVEPKWHLVSEKERIPFAARALASGKAGLLTVAGWILALFASARRKFDARERAIMVWALIGVAIIAAWIPLSWDIYLLLILPAWVLGGCIGFAAALRGMVPLRGQT